MKAKSKRGWPLVTAVICARMTSERFPGKVMADLCGKPLLQHIIERLQMSTTVADVIVATTENSADNPIRVLTAKLRIPTYLGSEHNVTQRMWGAVHHYGSGKPYIFRALSDQPLLDWVSLDRTTSIIRARGWDFILPLAFTEDPVYGGGIFPWSYRCWQAIEGNSTGEEREHVGMWLRRNLSRWDYGLIDLPHWMYRPYRLEVDTEDDLAMIEQVYKSWDGDGPPPLRWAVNWLDKHPSVVELNAHVREKTGTYTSYTQAEIEQWRLDYTGRAVIWSDAIGLVGKIENAHSIDYVCQKCGGMLVAYKITRHKGDLQTKCVRCGQTRVFYAIKPK